MNEVHISILIGGQAEATAQPGAVRMGPIRPNPTLGTSQVELEADGASDTGHEIASGASNYLARGHRRHDDFRRWRASNSKAQIIGGYIVESTNETAGVHGIHHVTVMAGDAQRNLDFYVTVMGLRLVKKSVNQDSPGTYHLFYADAVGSPGTDLTFFPWPDLPKGRPGVGQIVEVPFAISTGSLAYWRDRLSDHGVVLGDEETRFGEKTLTFEDPDGLGLAVVETDDDRDFVAWDGSTVPAERQLKGMHAVRIWERDLEPTEAVLTRVMGFAKLATEGDWYRYGVEGGGSGRLVDIRVLPGGSVGGGGAGTVHHAAWRVKDDEEELTVRSQVERAGLRPTPPIDRFWFKSVYFREPGGVLFELATDGPGFDRDEDPDHLGEELILPPWLESRRGAIENALPKLKMPQPASR